MRLPGGPGPSRAWRRDPRVLQIDTATVAAVLFAYCTAESGALVRALRRTGAPTPKQVSDQVSAEPGGSGRIVTMGAVVAPVLEETERVRRVYEREAGKYDRNVRIPERLLFSGGASGSALVCCASRSSRCSRGLLDRVARTLQARARRAAGSAQTRPRLSRAGTVQAARGATDARLPGRLPSLLAKPHRLAWARSTAGCSSFVDAAVSPGPAAGCSGDRSRAAPRAALAEIAVADRDAVRVQSRHPVNWMALLRPDPKQRSRSASEDR